MDQTPTARTRRALLPAALVALCAIPMLPTPQLDGIPRAAALMNLAHLPLAALVTWLLTCLLRRGTLAAGVAFVACLAIEGAQALLGTGEASLGDLAVDLAGIAACLSLLAASAGSAARRVALVIVTVLLCAWPVARTAWVFDEEHARAARFPQLADFEEAGELLPWKGTGGCRLRVAGEDPPTGSRSLECSFSPGARPAALFSDPPRDWSAYRLLEVQVFVPGGDPLPLYVKITDEVAFRDPKERFVRRYDLAPGHHALHIDLRDLVVSGAHRKIDTTRVKTLVFFVKSPIRKRVIFLDNISLSL